MTESNPNQSVARSCDGPRTASEGEPLPFSDFHSHLRNRAAATPLGVALTFLPSSFCAERVDLTYHELVEQSLAMSRILSRRLEPGQRALLLLPPSPHFAVAFLGCLAAGVIAVPLPVPVEAGAEQRVLNAAENCNPSVILSVEGVQELVSNAPAVCQLGESYDWLLVDHLPLTDQNPVAPLVQPDICGDDIALLQYTSGSTSSPRGVIVSHRNLMANGAAIRDSFQITDESTVVSWLPLHHDMGLIGGLLQPLYAGARGVILDSRSFARRPASWLEAISNERADVSGGPNFAYDLCIRTVKDKRKRQLDLSCWRVAFNGAAPVVPQTMRSFSNAFRDTGFRPRSHVPCYGLAESTLLVTAVDVDTEWSGKLFSVDSLESGKAREAPRSGQPVRELVAYPLPNHASIRVVDKSTAEPVEDGCIGEIVAGSDSNGRGYWEDPESSAETFGLAIADEPLTRFVRTGDTGFILDNELYIQGRSKDIIIHRGRNLHPEDLELDISSCDPAIRSGGVAVFGVRRDSDEAVIVCAEVRAATSPDLRAGISRKVRATLARIHGVSPYSVVLIPPGTICRTTSGKIRRHQMARRFASADLPVLFTHTVENQISRSAGRSMSLAEHLAATERHVGKGDAYQQTLTTALCEYVRELLELPATPGGEASLISLGADSLVAQQLQCEIEESLGIAASPGLALRTTSIAELAAAVSQRSADSVSAPAVDSGYELNSAQRGLWFLHQVDPLNPAYNITRAFRVTGEPDLEQLADALTRVYNRHPGLRLSLHAVNGDPQASIRPRGMMTVDCVDARSWDEQAVLNWHREFATRPFDLQDGPIIRAAAMRRESDWLLFLSIHHIACDGVAFAIIVSELAEQYREGFNLDESLVESATSAAERGPGAFERAILATREDELISFWQNMLAGEIPRLALPGPDPGEVKKRSSTCFAIDSEKTSMLQRLARESGLTLHNLLLSVWQVLLHRLTSQSDILIGVPTSCRNYQHVRDWVGNLVNVVPIRSSFDAGAGFAEFAQRTQRRVLDCVDHQEMPLSCITRIVNPDRDTASSSIFQAMFACYTTTLPAGQSAAGVLMSDPDAALSMGAVQLHGYPLPDYTTQADICLNVSVRATTLGFELQSDPDKVSSRLAGHIEELYTTLLDNICRYPDQEVGRIPWLTPQQVAERVAISMGPRVARPLHYLDSFKKVVETCPNRIAAEDEESQASYAELDERSNHVALRLRELGVGIDDNVIVSAARSIDYLVLLLGIHKADGCYVPVSPTEAPQRAAAMIEAVRPVACIADPVGHPLLERAFDKPLAGQRPAIIDLQELTAGRAEQAVSRISPDQGSSYIIHTSGSTGTPKAAISANAGLTNHLWQMIEYFDLETEDCVGQTGPVSFDVSVWQLLAPLIIGARVRIVPEPTSVSPAGLLEATIQGGITLLELVPSAVVALLDAGLVETPGALRIMIATGEALNSDVPRRWVREMPTMPLYNAYGPCECTDDVSIGLSGWGPDSETSISIGRALNNTSMLILDDNMQPVPPNVAGWLCVGGVGVGRGYLDNPRRTAEAFLPDPWSDIPGARLYRTGDLGKMAASGDVEFMGRADTQIKIRGLRIEPGEVEAALCECDGIIAAAAKVEKGSAGDFLAGFVVIDPEPSGVPAGEARPVCFEQDERLRTALIERLPRHMIPSVLVQVPCIPRSANGKTAYRELGYTPPETSGKNNCVPTDDPLATTIQSIWSDLLDRDSINWHDNFFQLGGHSLIALAMVDQVGQACGLEVCIDLVFGNMRLCDFVAAVRRLDAAKPKSGTITDSIATESRCVPSGDRGFSAPASAAQNRFWFLHELDPGQPTFNMPGVLKLQGPLVVPELENAIGEVLQQHQVLLARFNDEGGVLTWTPGSIDDFSLRHLDLCGAVSEFGEEVFDQIVNTEAKKSFDLRRELPFRVMLARLGPDDWRLFVCIDHIVCDAWSLNVFLCDLAREYNRRVREQLKPVAGQQHDFATYCFQERDRLGQRDGPDLSSEWQGLANGPVRLLPRFEETQSASGSDSAPPSFSIEGEDLDRMRELTAQSGTTPFMVFATALSALIHSGSEERETILFGTLIAQRERPEWQRLVGPLLNVSILGIDLALCETVKDALAHARHGALRAYRSSKVPYQDLIGQFGDLAGKNSLPFELLLVMQPELDNGFDFDELTSEIIEIDTGASPYPLVVDIEPGQNGYKVTHRFAEDQFDFADIQQLATSFEAMTREILIHSGPLEEILRRIESTERT